MLSNLSKHTLLSTSNMKDELKLIIRLETYTSSVTSTLLTARYQITLPTRLNTVTTSYVFASQRQPMTSLLMLKTMVVAQKTTSNRAYLKPSLVLIRVVIKTKVVLVQAQQLLSVSWSGTRALSQQAIAIQAGLNLVCDFQCINKHWLYTHQQKSLIKKYI